MAAKVGSFSPALDLGKASKLGAIHAWNRAAVSGERPETGRWKTYSCCGDYNTQLYCKSFLGMVKFYQQKEHNYFLGVCDGVSYIKGVIIHSIWPLAS